MTQTLESIEQNHLADIHQRHYEQIQEMESRCYQLQNACETDKAKAAASKKALDQAVAEMRQLIRDGADPQRELPFKEDWRTVPIGEAITLTEKQAEKFDEIGVKNVEQFEDLRAGKMMDYPSGLSDLPRVGDKLIQKWEDEIVEWMSKNAHEDEKEEEQEDEPVQKQELVTGVKGSIEWDDTEDEDENSEED